MKNRNNWRHGLRYAVAFTLTLCVFGCESKVDEGNAAFEDAKTLRTTQSDSLAIATEADAILANVKPAVAGNAVPRPKVIVVDPWIAFAKVIEARLIANEATIKTLKGTADNAKIFKKVAALEKENAGLRQQMSDYKAAEVARWDAFQASINQQVDVVAIGLKEMAAPSQ